MKENINIALLPMEYSIKGCSTPNEDGSYTIIINSRIPQDQHLKVYEHELRHIENGDFGTDDVDAAEQRAHSAEGSRL